MQPVKSSPALALALHLLLVVAFFIAFRSLSIPGLMVCTHPLARSAVLALWTELVFQISLGWKLFPNLVRGSLLGTTALSLLAFWLGTYPLSPLGFSTGRIPLLSGFRVTTRASESFELAPGGILTLASGSPAAIEPILLPVEIQCAWASANGGSLDSPETCGLSYRPPQAEYDLLKIRLQPACGLPEASAQIKISLLP